MNTNTSSTPEEQRGNRRAPLVCIILEAQAHRCFQALEEEIDILEIDLFASILELEERLEDLHILIDISACGRMIPPLQM